MAALVAWPGKWRFATWLARNAAGALAGPSLHRYLLNRNGCRKRGKRTHGGITR